MLEDSIAQIDFEEEVEEITEAELLALMEQEQDSLLVCQELFFGSFDFDQLVLDHMQMNLLYTQGLVTLSVMDTSDMEKAANEWATQGRFQPASQMRLDDDPFRARDARTDSIYWLHEKDTAFKQAYSLFTRLRQDLQKVMHLTGEMEIQLAHYEPNGGYDTHRDAFPSSDVDDDQRKVTAIIYLNSHWSKNDGGELQIHRKGLEQKISPMGGTMVIFLSGVIDHQVLPSSKNRFAITCWFR